jgi:hypothetical protein
VQRSRVAALLQLHLLQTVVHAVQRQLPQVTQNTVQR